MKSNTIRDFCQKYWKALFILFFVSALAYLPNITKFTLYKDDWYYIADGFFGGPKIFREMFYIDRPLRGYLWEFLFTLLKTDPLPYQILAYVWRLVSGMLYFWLLNLVWPKHEKTNLWISLLFLLYPGYLWWVSGVEYQPYILTQLLQVFSFVTMLLFLKTNNIFKKLLFLACSAAAGWTGLMFVDYTIGMELFRIVIVFLFVSHELPLARMAAKIKKTLLSWLPFLIIPAGFMIWRTFFFTNTRSETDISLQMGQFFAAPAQVGLVWLQNLIKSFFNINLIGWIQPFADNFFGLGLVEFLIATVLCFLAIIAVKKMISKHYLPEEDGTGSIPDSRQWEKEALFGGVIGVIGGIMPIVLMNREVSITSYSHYLLNPLMAAAPILFVLINFVRSHNLRRSILLSLIGFLVVSNYSYSVNIVKEETTIANFWQQVTLRAPRMAPDTTFLVNLPNGYADDNWDAIWAPVNYLYALPSDVVEKNGVVWYPFAGLQPAIETSKNILLNSELGLSYRTHGFYNRYDQMIVISQPSLDSCVHVIDSRWPRLSIWDNDQVLLFASKSDTSNIISPQTYLNYDKKIFGKLDENNWCGVYQKAELALQLEAWEKISGLKVEAETKGFKPGDEIEWMPFLQGAIYFGDKDQIKSIMAQITQPFVASQACTTYDAMQQGGYYSDKASMDANRDLVCHSVEKINE
ncbi:MAG TPA: hypothetical protein DIW44_02565 [Anaerolineaceae bacterium]|nr:hypothetical protein [Anaerolineaceae bacterium]